MNSQAPSTLPVIRIGDIVAEEEKPRWLIDSLWGASSVGVIGGAPKCCKTWLALDMALSVATGTPCLDKYSVADAGPVLVYLAEDALTTVKERVEKMARHRNLELETIPIHVITATVLRLDREPHRTQLLVTARQLQPRLILLDPLVRLHGIDENHAGEVAGLLAYFRSLQRQLDVSVVLVHHTRKNAGAAAGQGLRGSGDIHAFGDSNLYLRRSGERLILASEHRAAPAGSPVYLQLVDSDDEQTHLAVIGQLRNEKCQNLRKRVLDLLSQGGVFTRAKLREQLSVKNERLGEVLEGLEQASEITRTASGWHRNP